MSGQSGVLTRTFTAGAARFAVRCPDEHVRDGVESLFIDLDDSTGSPDQVVQVIADEEGKLALRLEDGTEYVAQHPDAAMSTLVTAVSRMALDAEPERLHLHAAALSNHGQGLLISAPSGTGKTTLAAALSQRGWAYTSDEAVAIQLGSTTCFGFPKPVMIKPGGTDLLPGLRNGRVRLDRQSDDWWHVPASSIPATIDRSIDPDVIAVLRMAADGTYSAPSVTISMHPTEAVVALVGQTMDAHRFGPDTLIVLAELTARARCVALLVGPLESSIAVVEELLSTPIPHHPLRVLEPPPAPEDQRWTVPRSVRSVLIGDRVVVHDTDAGAIVALDEAGSASWLAIHGEAPDWWPAELLLAESTIEFMTALLTYGLLEDTQRTEGHPGR